MISERQTSESRPEPLELRLFAAGAMLGTDWLFRGVDLTIPAGGWLVVMGPSGAGKTTLIRLIAGVIGPSEGEVQIAGRSWSDLRGLDRVAMRRKFGYVQQQPGLLHATVEDNVVTPLRWRGMTREAAVQRAHESLSGVGLEGLASQNALGLSGGERQRLAFARALAVRPDILLLDEFTNHQDPRREDLLESIVGQRIGSGASAVIVAHELGQVERLHRAIGSDPSIGVLVDGRWRAIGWNSLFERKDKEDAAGSFLQRLAERNAIGQNGTGASAETG